MNIIIVGAGEIGRHLATELSREAHSIRVIDSDPQLVAEMERGIDAKVICDDGSSVHALAEANIGECDLFLALTSKNTVNLMSASMAKVMGVETVASRVHPGLQREEWIFDFRGHFGIDHMFSSERLTAIELAKFIRNPDSLWVEELAQGKIELQQVRVGAKSDGAGTALKDLKAPERTRVAAITREGESFVPDADSLLEAGDVATIIGEPRRLRTLAEQLQEGGKRSEAMRVVIFGGGEYGFALAQMLESWDCRVRIFEKDEKVCQELTERLSHTTVINADATVVAELEEEQVGKADFFVATSSSDEDNVMTCLQANNIGTKNCLTIIHRADYARAIGSSGRHFGVVAAVSPREATRRDIERYLTEEKFYVVKKFTAGQVIETTVEKKAKAMGLKVGDIDWPAGSVLVGLVRGLNAIVPGPDDVVEAGDRIYAMVSPKGLKKLLKLLH
ncbi:MAG: Trk system potassium transporter TrkA [Roseibacillus sp.]|nr:Trk system potassium transporter TrkA [Roseibacillus sp.]